MRTLLYLPFCAVVTTNLSHSSEVRRPGGELRSDRPKCWSSCSCDYNDNSRKIKRTTRAFSSLRIKYVTFLMKKGEWTKTQTRLNAFEFFFPFPLFSQEGHIYSCCRVKSQFSLGASTKSGEGQGGKEGEGERKVPFRLPLPPRQ